MPQLKLDTNLQTIVKTETTEQYVIEREQSETNSTEQTPASSDRVTIDVNRSSDQPSSEHASAEESAATVANEYTYFVRRSNVDDERDIRLEIHICDMVADREAAFRSELAERLRTNGVSKTDPCEFAHLTAFRELDSVAELVREEGFGTLER